jgi:hypothetical protein
MLNARTYSRYNLPLSLLAAVVSILTLGAARSATAAADTPTQPTVAALSWVAAGQSHLRVYSVTGSTVTERGSDGGGAFWTGASFGGTSVGATNWVDSTGNIHLRLYVGNAGQIIEYAFDPGGWNSGNLIAYGTGASATSWQDSSGELHLRVYISQQDGTVVEDAWEGHWYLGDY